MRVGERGQVTIPLEIRRKFGIDSTTPVEFAVVNGTIVLKKSPVKPGIRRCFGVKIVIADKCRKWGR